jgi:hypothetical protein
MNAFIIPLGDDGMSMSGAEFQSRYDSSVAPRVFGRAIAYDRSMPGRSRDPQ